MTGLKNIHTFLSRNLFYPLALSTLFVFFFFAGRVMWSRQVVFLFLIWNLFLAWLPYLFGLALVAIHQARPKWWWALLIPGVLWLLFLPNAFYIMTDLIHLKNRDSIPLWYDAGLLSISAWTGIFLAVSSLHMAQRVVQSYAGKLAGWIFSFAVIGLSGYGVYLGRFLRWNSWDFLVQPLDIISDSLTPLTNPMNHKDKIAFMVMYTALFFVTYLTFSWLRPMAADKSGGVRESSRRGAGE
jgi:uncharacterized membrane protein